MGGAVLTNDAQRTAQASIPPATMAKLRKAASDFEAQAFSQLLQPMFSTVDGSKGPMGGGAAEAQWQPMLVDAYAKSATAAGGIGLAAPVLREMIRMQAAGAHIGGGKP